MMWTDKKKHGKWLTWAGDAGAERFTVYFRAGLVFAVLGFSGDVIVVVAVAAVHVFVVA